MATPTLSSHVLPGALGDILVDVRAGSRRLSQPAVLLVHGFKGFKDFAFLPFVADRLAREGFVAVTASVSGSGVDEKGDFTRLERFRKNTYSLELDDLATITNALNCGKFDVAQPSSIGLLGHSRGGGMSLLLARQLGIVAAVVTWSAIGRARRHTDGQIAAWKRAGTIDIPHARLRIRLPLDYDVVEDCLANEDGLLNIAEAATSLRRPWLQVHGTADETVPFTEAEELASHGNQGHQIVAVDGAGHTYGTTHPWGGPTPELLSTLDRSLAFLAINLR